MVRGMSFAPSDDPARAGGPGPRLVLRNVALAGGGTADVAVVDQRIVAVAPALPDLLPGAEIIDGRGGLLLPGLQDHHLHILALAARRVSVDLAGLIDPSAIRARLAAAPGRIVRAVGYDERAAGLPDAALLDTWLPDRPLRLQDRTGALWVLNSQALALLGGRLLPPGAERDANGTSNGRFWREDRWLGAAFPRANLDLAGLGRELAALGLTALTDAGAHNGPEEAATLGGASLPQRLTLMGSEALGPGAGYALGPLKLLLDERDPPAVEALAGRIAAARAQGRGVAAHCVTEGELAIYLGALDLAGGARPEDRIEHGGMIPESFIPIIARAGLTVATNPAFLHDRGDRYHDQIADRADLYRIASLLKAGIVLKAGSDAPYASVDPWLGMRSARDRLSAGGVALSAGERIEAVTALALYGDAVIAPGGVADLVLCHGGKTEVMGDLDAGRVRLTVIGGRVVHGRN